MHEVAIMQSVVDMVVERTAGRQIQTVRLQVGTLSGVVADALRFCFDVVAMGTPLEGSSLEIHEVGGRGACRSCGAEFAVDDLILLCRCGSADVRVVAGRELHVTSVEMVEESCA